MTQSVTSFSGRAGGLRPRGGADGHGSRHPEASVGMRSASGGAVFVFIPGLQPMGRGPPRGVPSASLRLLT